MDSKIVKMISDRPDFLKDNQLKYLEFEALVPNRLGKLREIVESLPQGKQKASAVEIIDWIHESFQRVVNDWACLQEGSKLRNILADHVATQKANDNSRTSPQKDSK
jgi:hypothetical protein